MKMLQQLLKLMGRGEKRARQLFPASFIHRSRVKRKPMSNRRSQDQKEKNKKKPCHKQNKENTGNKKFPSLLNLLYP